MAQVPPGQPIAPGIASGNTYPQWGVSQSGSSWKTIEAKNESQKNADTSNGYLVWFSSQAAAENFISSETSVLNGSVSGIPGLTDIANFFDKLGEANTWIRIGEVILGLVLVAAGVAKLTHAVPIATKIAGAVA